MENLMVRKQEIYQKHEDKLKEVNSEILNLMTNSIKDKNAKAGVNVDLGLLNSLKVMLQASSETSLGMDSHDRLEYSKLWFEQARFMVDTMKSDPGYQSVMKDIDEQLELYRKEISQIDEELKNVENDETRKKLLEERKEGWTKRA
ncbi:MAG: hypothetical protein WAW23_00955 [Candidatus Methanoperedens sp.]